MLREAPTASQQLKPLQSPSMSGRRSSIIILNIDERRLFYHRGQILLAQKHC